jgi:PQQ-dependent dehydrogenase (s-GDH family)
MYGLGLAHCNQFKILLYLVDMVVCIGTKKQKIRNMIYRHIMSITIAGILLLSLIPTVIFSSPYNNIVPPAAGQPEDPFPSVSNETLTPAQRAAREKLLQQEGFSVKVLVRNLSAPLNILYGPDGVLWITERMGKSITRIDPVNGTEFSSTPVPNVHQSAGQDGVLGMVFDPKFNDTNLIFVAYTYDADPGAELDRRTKITQFYYDPNSASISEPKDLISGLSGSGDHNSGRMTFGPDGKLYYTIGDQGKNQLALACLNNEAQHLPTAEQVAAKNWTAYQGKVLRMNTDGSIPDDNPVIDGVKSHIFTYGHRNAQGIAVGPNGDLYVAEHGDNSDDEINHLEAAGNYGWPYVSGFNDNKAYQFYNWSAAANCNDLEFNDVALAPPGVTVSNESDFKAPDLVPPVHTFYTVNNDFNFTEQAKTCGNLTSVCYPTVAPSSLRLYTSNVIPEWENKLLMTTLKAGRIFQIGLDENGKIVGSPIELFRSENRYRDIAFDPDGRTIYVITDMMGPVQAMKEGPITPTTTLWSPGSVLMFRYER